MAAPAEPAVRASAAVPGWWGAPLVAEDRKPKALLRLPPRLSLHGISRGHRHGPGRVCDLLHWVAHAAPPFQNRPRPYPLRSRRIRRLRGQLARRFLLASKVALAAASPLQFVYYNALVVPQALPGPGQRHRRRVPGKSPKGSDQHAARPHQSINDGGDTAGNNQVARAMQGRLGRDRD